MNLSGLLVSMTEVVATETLGAPMITAQPGLQTKKKFPRNQEIKFNEQEEKRRRA